MRLTLLQLQLLYVKERKLTSIQKNAILRACGRVFSTYTALANPNERDSAMLTFMITASGVNLWGVGAAFWGLLVGLLAHLLSKRMSH